MVSTCFMTQKCTRPLQRITPIVSKTPDRKKHTGKLGMNPGQQSYLKEWKRIWVLSECLTSIGKKKEQLRRQRPRRKNELEGPRHWSSSYRQSSGCLETTWSTNWNQLVSATGFLPCKLLFIVKITCEPPRWLSMAMPMKAKKKTLPSWPNRLVYSACSPKRIPRLMWPHRFLTKRWYPIARGNHLIDSSIYYSLCYEC